MVQRLSNPLGFQVLESPPTQATGIRAEVLDANGNVLAVLGDSFDRSWTSELNGTGAGTLSLMADHPALVLEPALFAAGNLVRLSLDGVPRFVFKIEARGRRIVGKGEDAARAITVAGRGALALLEDAAVYPAGGIAGDADRLFTTNAGDMLTTLVTEAQARGSIQVVGQSYTAAVDSLGAPWSTAVNLTQKGGKTDLLRVALQVGEVAADVWMTPGLVLDVRNTRGVDRSLQLTDSGPVELRTGVDIVELDADEDAVIINALVISTPAGLVERIDAASITEHGRRERPLSLGNVTDPSQITRHAKAVFARTANPAGRTAYRVVEGEQSAGRVPYVNFAEGDWIKAPDADGNLTRQRVRAITVSDPDGDDGRPTYIVELASLAVELEARLARWVASMTRGGLGGVADAITEPDTVTPAEVTVSGDEAAAAAIAEHVGLFLHPDELTDLADVDATGIADGDALVLNSGTSKFEPRRVFLPVAQRRRRDGGDQSVPDSTFTAIELSTDTLAEAAAFLTWNGTTHLYDVQRDCLLQITAGLIWGSNATGSRIMRVVHNANVLASDRRNAVVGGQTLQTLAVGPIAVEAGDTIQLDGWQDSGGNLDAKDDGRTVLGIAVLRDDG